MIQPIAMMAIPEMMSKNAAPNLLTVELLGFNTENSVPLRIFAWRRGASSPTTINE